MLNKVTFYALLLSLAGCSSDGAGPAGELHRLFEEEWEFRLREDPLFATFAGVHDFNDRLTDVSRTAHQRRAAYLEKLLERLIRIDRDRLSRQDRISYDVFRLQLENRIADFHYRTYLIPILADGGFHTDFARLPENVPLVTVQDYENYILRLQAFRHYAGQHIELMREGLQTGFTQPQVILEGWFAEHGNDRSRVHPED